MVAIKRVYRMLRVRSAVLSDRLIQIRGLGSYLTYFDGATRSHMDAVVHTRQSMPPVAMDQLNISSVVKEIEISSDGYGHFSLGINVISTCKSKVVVLFDYNMRNFQQLIVQARTDLNGNTVSDSKLLSIITGVKSYATSSAPTAMYPRFHRSEVCSFECLSQEVAAGAETVRFSLPPTVASLVQDRIAQPASADASSKLTIGVMMVPAASSSFRNTADHSAQLSTGRLQQHRLRLDPEAGDGTWTGAELRDLQDAAANEDDASSVLTGSDAGSGRDGGSGGGGLFASGRNPLTSSLGTSGKRASARRKGGAGGGGKSSPTASSSSSRGYVNAGMADRDSREEEEDEESEPAQQQQHSVRESESVLLGIFVHFVSLPVLRTASTSTSTSVSASGSTAPSELVVLDRQLNAYSSQEVFGLASSHKPTTTTTSTHQQQQQQTRPSEPLEPSATPSPPGGGAATPSPCSSAAAAAASESVAAAVCSGGCFVAEDCVVCLTDHKQVLLLPCRHLCVCEACLVFIDKCPVCRAAFDEYITIKPDSNNHDNNNDTAATVAPAHETVMTI